MALLRAIVGAIFIGAIMGPLAGRLGEADSRMMIIAGAVIGAAAAALVGLRSRRQALDPIGGGLVGLISGATLGGLVGVISFNHPAALFLWGLVGAIPGAPAGVFAAWQLSK